MLGQVIKSLSNVQKCQEVAVDGLGSADLQESGFHWKICGTNYPQDLNWTLP